MKKIAIFLIVLIVLSVILILGTDLLVVFTTKGQIVQNKNYYSIDNVECIIILGAAVWDGKPCPMLEDRLMQGIDLYKRGIAKKILMSGDHSTDEYDEVTAMKKYAIEQGVPSEAIFMDHAGVSTYDSIYRAKKIFGLNKVVIVTQEYHLYRALFIANQVGLDAIRC